MTLSGRLAFAMVFLVVATTVALSLFTYHFVTESLVPRALDRLGTKAALGAIELEAALTGARQDLLVIQSAVGVQQLVATRSAGPVVPQADAQLRESIAKQLVAALRGKPDYVQFALSEWPTVEAKSCASTGKGRTVRRASFADSELRPRGERDYVKKTMSLAGAAVYMSQIQPETDRATQPDRFCFTWACRCPHDGTPFGIILIDYDLGPVFEHIRSRIAGTNQVAIVNSAGDYLLDFGPGRRLCVKTTK